MFLHVLSFKFISMIIDLVFQEVWLFLNFWSRQHYSSDHQNSHLQNFSSLTRCLIFSLHVFILVYLIHWFAVMMFHTCLYLCHKLLLCRLRIVMTLLYLTIKLFAHVFLPRILNLSKSKSLRKSIHWCKIIETSL